ncbi:hypothetical protein [Streptomyces niveus]|uniref:hypothetical protein n=1 Tax=Streptomyces niveus TaxID=193462 RepID=UPI0033B83967
MLEVMEKRLFLASWQKPEEAPLSVVRLSGACPFGGARLSGARRFGGARVCAGR